MTLFAKRMSVVAALTATAMLQACGPPAEQTPPAPAVPTPPPLTDAERAAMLAALPAPYSQADLDNGRAAFARCRSCHTITPNGPNMTGPNLYGLMGRQAGTHAGFAYSRAVRDAGFAWDDDRIDHWLQNPRTFLPGNKMAYPGLADATDRRDLIAYLSIETAARPVAP